MTKPKSWSLGPVKITRGETHNFNNATGEWDLVRDRYLQVTWGRFEAKFSATDRRALQRDADHKAYRILKARVLSTLDDDARFDAEEHIEMLWGEGYGQAITIVAARDYLKSLEANAAD